MFCNTCGADIPNTSRFCPMCGDSFLVSPNQRRRRASSTSQVAPFVAGGIFLLAGLGYFAYMNHRLHSVRADSAIRVLDRSYDQLTKKPHNIPVSIHGLTINQLGYSYFKLAVPATASSVELHGNFTASGGAGNTIEVFVFSENGYGEWQKQQEAHPFYRSGKVSMDTIEAELPSGSGTYYLVFNNKFSSSTPKTISLDARLTYYR
ncbi:MAG TPA: zinc-ribbon domain-containing protein [Candidatus Aquilonibacter sp.]|nr:zinc-ribbon domain-containing protein [Candidatus Aquilonibacter sp.]